MKLRNVFIIWLFSLPLLSQPVMVLNKQMKDDIRFLKQTIVSFHPGYDKNISRTDLEKSFDSLAAQLPAELSEREFRLKLNYIISRIGCGHTDVYPSKKYLKYLKRVSPGVLPLECRVFDGQVFITKNLSDDSTIVPYSKIISVNGISADSIYRNCLRTVSSDGYNVTHKQYYADRNFPTALKYLIGRQDSFLVRISDTTNTISEKWIKKGKGVVTKMAPKQLNVSKPANGIPVKKNVYRIAQTNHYYFDLDSADKSGYMRISRFTGKRYRKFYRKAFRHIKQAGIKYLVLDLRANGGGKLADASRLISYLVDSTYTTAYSRKSFNRFPYRHFTRRMEIRGFKFFAFIHKKKTNDGRVYYKYRSKSSKRNHYTGKIILLQDGGTFSAAVYVASYLKNKSKSTIIGEETGGGESGCNAIIIPSLVLPNTGVSVRFPLYTFDHMIGKPFTHRGVFPDFEMKPALVDYKLKKDVGLQKAIEIIRNK